MINGFGSGKIPYDITFHPSWWYKNAGIHFDKKFFYDPEYRIEADICMRKVLYEKFGEFGLGERSPKPRPIIDSDLIAGEFVQSMMMGCNVLFSDSNLPEVICADMNEEIIDGMEYQEIRNNGFWDEFVSQMDYLEGKFGYIESHIDLHGVQNLALDLRGIELFVDYFERPKIANKILSLCTNLILQVGQYLSQRSAVISAGVTSIMKQINPSIYVTSNCTVDMVSNETYEDFLLKWDDHLSSKFGKFGIHHCGKTMEHLVEGYLKVGNLCFLEVGAFSNIKEIRNAFPDKFLNLRYSPVRLKEVTEIELGSDIGLMMSEGYKRGLTSISCVGIDADTPDHSINAFLRTANSIYFE
jgi:hypothetical protein